MTHPRAPLSPDLVRRRIEPATAPDEDRNTIPGIAAGSQDRFARGVLAVWWLLFLVGTFLEPAPDGGDPAVLGTLDLAIGLAAVLVLVAVSAALLSRSGGGARGGWIAFGGGLFFFGLSLACPATSHHAVAGWWFGQLAASAGMVVAGLVAVRHALRRR